ncbi:MAG: flagellar basal body P-ring formation protein FlgA [Rhodospirillales bacterium]|nr:flagellar basal body P-ring formation protein FlgA [Alphaproteobacteria bacterium]MBL6947989.1 flagellar basal body P-ring formation protein FlgA [Rhodospirillales bacterium]
MRTFILALTAVALLLPSMPAMGAEKVSARTADKGIEVKPGTFKVLLRESATVKNKMIYLDDVFANAGEDKAGIVIAYAPDPGKRAVFDARWLYRVARTYGLDWRPMGVQDQIVVERKSQVITRDEIEDAILAALAKQGAEASMTLQLSNRMMRLYVPAGVLATVGVDDAAYEPRTGRFTAIITAPANDPRAQRHRVTGRAHKMTEVPVLNRRVLAKEVITKRDIKWLRVRSDRLRRDAIVDAENLIGMAAKRGLRQGRALHASSVQRPILVAKGSLVTINLRVPKMTLTSQGKALENGSDGDIVRIANTRSNKVIEAEVTGMGKVSVLPTGFTVMN